jgi:metallo-beta-lactamase family protein
MSHNQLQFLGAAGCVTGSRTLLGCNGRRVLIDAGLFQGYKNLRRRNWERFSPPPDSIEAVFLTHAHLDHSGYLPVLAAAGFKGPIYCTEATRDLCEILLLDAAHIQEEEAAFANRHRFSRHHPARALFDQHQARRAISQMETVAFGHRLELGEIKAQWHPNGHILGSGSLLVQAAGQQILFSGDLGRPADSLMRAPESPPGCDVLVLESTYGDKRHLTIDAKQQLADVVRETVHRGGDLLIPAFAVGRAQLVMLLLHRLQQSGEIPSLPVYLDSPMAIDTSQLMMRYPDQHRLNVGQCQTLFRHIHYTRTPEQSKALAAISAPKIIISASGMATGGRVLHHLKRMLGDSRNTILFAGYQAGGTRGARLVNGEESIKIHGHYYPVEADIQQLDSLSAHADNDEILQWLRKMPVAPKQILINHGEPSAADHLRVRLQEELGWSATVPAYRDSFDL